MKSRRNIMVVVVLIALAGGAWWFASIPKVPVPEPGYGGKRLSEWMNNLGYFNWAKGNAKSTNVWLGRLFPNDKTSPEEDYDTKMAIKQIGTNAFPVLKPLLHATFRERLYFDWLVKVPQLSKRVPLEGFGKRRKPIAAIGCMDELAIPFLIPIFEDEHSPSDVRIFAAWMFSQYPQKSLQALPALRRAVHNVSSSVAGFSQQAIEAIEKGVAAPQWKNP